MSMRNIILVFVCVLISRAAIYAATPALRIAQRAQSAERLVSYRGIKSVQVKQGSTTVVSTVKIVHQKPDFTRKEFFSPNICAGVVLIDRGQNRWKYDPVSRRWEQVRWMFNADMQPHISDNHIVQLVGSETVAGRDAYVITVVSKQADKARHRIWVDKKTYLMLKISAQNEAGDLTCAQFTNISIEPKDIASSIFAIPGNVHKPDCPSCVGFTVRKPTYLPKGYKMMGQTSGMVGGHCYVHLQYSNGVNVISLFERKCSETPTPPKMDSVMTWVNRGIMFTLVSEIADSEMKKIASSLK